MHEHTHGKTQIQISYNLLSEQKLWGACCNYEAFSNNFSLRWIYAVSQRWTIRLDLHLPCIISELGRVCGKGRFPYKREFIGLSSNSSQPGIFSAQWLLGELEWLEAFSWMILIQAFTLLRSPSARSLILPAPQSLVCPSTVISWKEAGGNRCHYVD